MWVGLTNPETQEEEICSIHREKGRTYFIFYSSMGEYVDFKVEVYE
jgi:hypothetical protein